MLLLALSLEACGEGSGAAGWWGVGCGGAGSGSGGRAVDVVVGRSGTAGYSMVGCGGSGAGGFFGAGAEETIEAAGDEDVPFVVVDGRESGKGVVKLRVREKVDGRFRVAWWGGESIEALNGKASLLE